MSFLEMLLTAAVVVAVFALGFICGAGRREQQPSGTNHGRDGLAPDLRRRQRGRPHRADARGEVPVIDCTDFRRLATRASIWPRFQPIGEATASGGGILDAVTWASA